MSDEWEETLIRLHVYVPFLIRAKANYISSPKEIEMVAQLITVMSSAEIKRYKD